MCKYGTGRRGLQGPTGPTGASGSSISIFTASSSLFSAAPKTLNIITSAATTGSVVYNGVINVETVTNPNEITITPYINGVAQTARAIVQTMPSQIGGFCRSVVSVSGVLTITQGQSFDIQVALNAYVNTPRLTFASVNYNLQ